MTNTRPPHYAFIWHAWTASRPHLAADGLHIVVRSGRGPRAAMGPLQDSLVPQKVALLLWAALTRREAVQVTLTATQAPSAATQGRRGG
jgi:hypothetical protein